MSERVVVKELGGSRFGNAEVILESVGCGLAILIKLDLGEAEITFRISKERAKELLEHIEYDVDSSAIISPVLLVRNDMLIRIPKAAGEELTSWLSAGIAEVEKSLAET